tara:strand:+ start:251 stop:607 length:357 start_codon:yes stop_codon:yes gene_type:complete
MKHLLIAATLALTACATVGTQVDPVSMAEFKSGETTYSDVISRLGLPQMDMALPDDTRQIAYIYSQARVKAATMVPVVGLFAGGADSETTTVTFIFDEDDVLTDTTTGQSAMEVRNGF